MNVERFAGDNEIMKLFAAQLKQNEATMKSRQSEALQNAYEARARDVTATGVSNASSYL